MSGDTPISDTDAIFARAYANAIKTKFGVDVGQNYCILTSPVTQRGIAAGDLIYPEMTNYLMYKFCDSLQYSDNPTYTGGSAGSYIQQLSSYINWVKTKSNPSQVVAKKMADTRDAFTAADDKYWTEVGKGQTKYKEVKDLYPATMTFWTWANSYFPSIATAEKARKSAQGKLYQAMNEYFGPDAATLAGYMDNITSALGSIPMPGYTMDGLLDDKDLIEQMIKYANSGDKPDDDSDTAQAIKQSIVQVPSYTFGTYSSTVNDWITQSGNGASRDNVLQVKIDQGRQTRWEDYGFTQIQGGGNVGYWPFFSVEVNAGETTETSSLNTDGRETDVSLQLAMIGIQKFDIRPGSWDVANIKALFPNRADGAPADVLGPKFAQVTSVIVGYDVELQLNFAESMRSEVHELYNKAVDANGSLSIFGFDVSGGASGSYSDRVNTSFDDVKWDQQSGSMTLAPSKGQVYPTILGVVCQRFD